MMEHIPIFWQGFSVGLAIGAYIGIIFYGLCLIAKKRGMSLGAQKETTG